MMCYHGLSELTSAVLDTKHDTCISESMSYIQYFLFWKCDNLIYFCIDAATANDEQHNHSTPPGEGNCS